MKAKEFERYLQETEEILKENEDRLDGPYARTVFLAGRIGGSRGRVFTAGQIKALFDLA